MKTYGKPIFAAFVVLCCLMSGGCRNLPWRKDADTEPKPSRSEIMTNDDDVMVFNNFRTIGASPRTDTNDAKRNRSLLWDKSEARDIERRLGVVHD